MMTFCSLYHHFSALLYERIVEEAAGFALNLLSTSQPKKLRMSFSKTGTVNED